MKAKDKLSIYSSRILLLKKIGAELRTHYFDNPFIDNVKSDIIKQIKFGHIVIAVGEQISIYGERFNVDEILDVGNKVSSIGHKIITSKQTKTSKYILPALNFTRTNISWGRNGSFINAYLGNSLDGSNEPNQIHLLFRVFGLFKNNKFLIEFLKKSNTFIREYILDDYHIVYVFEINDKYSKDIRLFKESKYSELSSNLKQKIIEFHDIKKDDHIYGVLFKTEELRDKLSKLYKCNIPVGNELGEAVNFEQEYITDKCILKLIKNPIVL